jgi:hypothetical protein
MLGLYLFSFTTKMLVCVCVCTTPTRYLHVLRNITAQFLPSAFTNQEVYQITLLSVYPP